MKNIWTLIKNNKWYIICFLCGLVFITFGGIYWGKICGKLLVGIGIILSAISALLGLKASDDNKMEWEELD